MVSLIRPAHEEYGAQRAIIACLVRQLGGSVVLNRYDLMAVEHDLLEVYEDNLANIVITVRDEPPPPGAPF